MRCFLAASLLAIAFVPPLAAQTSSNTQLLSRVARAGTSGYAGVWGYVDPATGREFAAVGAANGTWIVETTNPQTPVERGFIAGANSIWREVSGYRQYLYAVTEATGGVQIISMVNPDNPVLVKNFTRTGWNNTHSVSVDQGAGKLYCNGTSQGMLVFDLTADPTTPVFIGSYTSTYVHDSFIQHGFAYLSCINSGQLRILDVANQPSMPQLSATLTPNRTTHNTWTNSADTIAVTTDETSTGYLQVYDISNKRLPVALGKYSVAGAGVHNAFIVDDTIVHMAYYGGGYRVADISNPNAPFEVGYYRTQSAWGCYPFQPSGVVYVTGIPSNGGLYCLRVTCGVPQRYGQASAGTGGVAPRIGWSGGIARVGNASFAVTGVDLLPNAAAFMLLGATPTNTPVLGISLLVDAAPPAIVFATSASSTGTASLAVPIPNNAAFGNQSVYAQWLVVDGGAAQGLAASAGMKVTVCP